MRYFFIFTISYLSLLWERLCNRLWAAASLVLFFIALSLLNIPQGFGTAGHILFIGFFSIALVAVFIRTKGAFSFPARAEVERQMEKASAIKHRPLDTLHDKPVEGLSEESLALWRKHLKKAALYIDRLRIYTPQNNIARQDRLALRHAAVIFLAVGLVVAQNDGMTRIRQAFSPNPGSFTAKTAAAFDLWITPPEYTREPAIFLATAGQGIAVHDKDVHVPQGSILKLRLAGYSFAPRLRYAGQSYTLTQAAPGNFIFEMPLQQSGELRLASLFSRLGQWSITVAPDTAPEISIVQIEATPRFATKITYQAHDDHGIVKMSGLITLAQGNPDNKTWRFDIPPSGGASHVEDLTAHIWAGLPVTVALEAEDNAGHKSTSAASAFVLPERLFTNPIARALIEERKKLLWSDNALTRRAVMENLARIAEQPQLYKGDPVVFLSLAIAVKRLTIGGSGEAVTSVQGLLWDVAVRLEDGGLSLAQRELSDALQKMSNALNDRDISRERLQDILDDVQKKMQQYVQSLAMELQQRLQQGKKIPLLSTELARKFMKNVDLGKMLQQMRQLSQINSRAGLQKMAGSLKSMIDNLDMKKFDQMQEKQMQAMEALQNLDDIIHRQQALFDKTNKTADPAKAKGLSAEQSALRQQLGASLGKLGEILGDIPDNFAKASQSMKLSEDSLGKGRARDSLPHQKTALDELQKGLDNAMSKAAEAMQQSIMSFGLQPNSGNYGEGYDPLGRGLSDDSVKIPDEKEQRRVQEIIQELRRRSNEPNRTKVERDYIDRLLDQF